MYWSTDAWIVIYSKQNNLWYCVKKDSSQLSIHSCVLENIQEVLFPDMEFKKKRSWKRPSHFQLCASDNMDTNRSIQMKSAFYIGLKCYM